MTHSAIYEGAVRHRRFAGAPARVPPPHRDGLPRPRRAAAAARRPARRRAARARALPPRATTSATRRCRSTTRSATWSRERTGPRAAGPVRLLTHLRTFGHCFNPVSFYYCFAADGERLEAVVAEVTNTPWGERHAYVLPPATTGDGFDKALHVSPFMGMDQRYDVARARRRARRCSVHIESSEQGSARVRRDARAAPRARSTRARWPASPRATPPRRCGCSR